MAEFMTVKELARYLAFSERAIYALIPSLMTSGP